MIAAEGEQKASRALREAAEVIAESPSALQLRSELHTVENFHWIFRLCTVVHPGPDHDHHSNQNNHKPYHCNYYIKTIIKSNCDQLIFADTCRPSPPSQPSTTPPSSSQCRSTLSSISCDETEEWLLKNNKNTSYHIQHLTPKGYKFVDNFWHKNGWWKSWSISWDLIWISFFHQKQKN